MIPLLKARIPEVDKWLPFYERSIAASRYSNNGPCYVNAVGIINETLGYNCLVSNATVALELAIRARFKQGSRILIPSFTFKATYLAVLNAGMKPVVTAVDENTWALNPFDLYTCDGAVVVSPFGHTIDFASYEATGVPIVYDLAGAWGLKYRGPNPAVYSFHATKIPGIGEGACVVSNDYNLVRRIERMANFEHTNAKISEVHCAQLLAHLEHGVHYTQGYPLKTNTLERDFSSLHVYEFPARAIYPILTNPVFEARRYYYPLIEDLYEVETLARTPKFHPTRHTIALPRDVNEAEKASVLNTLEMIGRDLLP
jgi:dTDP-4-amino-4,6-dideoxygalactose transaminase